MGPAVARIDSDLRLPALTSAQAIDPRRSHSLGAVDRFNNEEENPTDNQGIEQHIQGPPNQELPTGISSTGYRKALTAQA